MTASDPVPLPPHRLLPWRRDVIALVLMWVAVAAVYAWPKEGGRRLASDFWTLHVHRMTFAREAISDRGALPGWYPRELLGTPFWSNIQNFPFLPTRLLVLLLDPEDPHTYTLAITLAACLAAAFTYLYARRIGIGLVGSAAAGWTFACCGYFASRVAAGHLPLLEVYGALPLLLWCVESLAQARESGRPPARWIAALGIASMCVMLGGHPQLPVYALSTTLVYTLWRFGLKRAVKPLAGMTLGAGIAAFALVPMAMLIGRSTRVLALADARNDLAMPYGRLLGFFLPWRDGAARPLPRAADSPFTYPNAAWFWDTFCYAGWVPWIAAVVLLVLMLGKRIRPGKAGLFIAAMGIAGIVLSLPIVQQISAVIPGTFLRSPARILYLAELSLAIGLGAAVQMLLGAGRAWAPALVAIVLLAHVIDLGRVSREFDVRDPPVDRSAYERAVERTLALLGDGRVAMDWNLPLRSNRRHDDVGCFDSILLARPYALLMDLSGAPPDLNEQQFDGSQLSPRALEAAGVKFIFTFRSPANLIPVEQLENLGVYMTRNPAARAAFFPHTNVAVIDQPRLRSALRGPGLDVNRLILLPEEVVPRSWPPDTSTAPAQVIYHRPGPDRIECRTNTGQFGYLRIIESWDPGWSATVDGVPVEIAPALGALLAVPLVPGTHKVVLEFHTPGKWMGITISLLCASGLVMMVILSRRGERGRESLAALGA